MEPKRKVILDKIIPPKTSLAFVLKKGQHIRITDVEGKQVGDFIIFNEENLKEKFSQRITRGRKAGGEWPKIWTANRISTRGKLYSNIHNIMMTIIQDTPIQKGVHDLFLGPCATYDYGVRGIDSREGCLELLTKALKNWGITKEDIPGPFNVFMNTIPDPKTGRLYIQEPVSRPGDYVELKAEMDCVAALSACPEDTFSLTNGLKCTPLRVTIYSTL